jgi:hypothetical protein
VVIAADKLRRRPNVPLAAFATQAAMTTFLETLDWVVAEIRESGQSPT